MGGSGHGATDADMPPLELDAATDDVPGDADDEDNSEDASAGLAHFVSI